MPVHVEFAAHRDGGSDKPGLSLFCDGVEASGDPPMVETGTGATPKTLRPHTIVLYGVDAVALGRLEWKPTVFIYPDAEATSKRIVDIDSIELDVTRNVVTLHLSPA